MARTLESAAFPGVVGIWLLAAGFLDLLANFVDTLRHSEQLGTLKEQSSLER